MNLEKLKKIWKHGLIALVMVVSMFSGMINVARAANNVMETRRLYLNYIRYNGEHRDYVIGFALNNQVVFCVEEPVATKNGVVYQNQGIYEKLSTDQQHHLSYLSYFGYGFNGDLSLEMRVATQFAIWEYTGNRTINFSQYNGVVENSLNGTPGVMLDANLVRQKLDQLKQRVTKWEQKIKPSFNNQTVKLNGTGQNNSVTLTDNNNVLDGFYNTTTNNAIHLEKNGNKLTVWANQILNDINKFNFRFGMTNRLNEIGAPIVYSSGNHQKVLKLGFKDPDSITFNVVMANGNLKINKTNFEGTLVDGAVFELKHKTENYSKDVIVTNGSITVNDLMVGDYTLVEKKAPQGHVLSKIIHELKVEDNKTTEKTIINKRVEVSKKSITGNDELEGAKLSVVDENNKVVDTWISGTKKHNINNLEAGKTYTLKEEITPNGFVEASDITFTVNEDGSTQLVEMIDGSVVLSKVDDEGNYVAKALLEARDENNKVVDSWESGKHIFDLSNKDKEVLKENNKVEGNNYTITKTPDNDYQLMIKEVKDGKTNYSYWYINEEGNETRHLIRNFKEGKTYTVVETQAPKGYATAKPIKVTASNKEQDVKMVDSIIKFEISKVDITNNKELEGASLEVRDEEGNVIDSWVSTATPYIIKGLEANKTYTLIETIAPKGYKIAQNITFKVEDTGEVQKVVMKDELLPKKVKTGDDNFIGVFLGEICLSSIGIYFFIRRKSINN